MLEKLLNPLKTLLAGRLAHAAAGQNNRTAALLRKLGKPVSIDPVTERIPGSGRGLLIVKDGSNETVSPKGIIMLGADEPVGAKSSVMIWPRGPRAMNVPIASGGPGYILMTKTPLTHELGQKMINDGWRLVKKETPSAAGENPVVVFEECEFPAAGHRIFIVAPGAAANGDVFVTYNRNTAIHAGKVGSEAFVQTVGYHILPELAKLTPAEIATSGCQLVLVAPHGASSGIAEKLSKLVGRMPGGQYIEVVAFDGRVVPGGPNVFADGKMVTFLEGKRR